MNSNLIMILGFRGDQRRYLDLAHRVGKFMFNLMGNHFILYKRLYHRLITLVCTAAIGSYDHKITYSVSLLIWFHSVFLRGFLDHFLVFSTMYPE